MNIFVLESRQWACRMRIDCMTNLVRRSKTLQVRSDLDCHSYHSGKRSKVDRANLNVHCHATVPDYQLVISYQIQEGKPDSACIFFRAITLDGAEIGLDFFLFNPDWSYLYKLDVRITNIYIFDNFI